MCTLKKMQLSWSLYVNLWVYNRHPPIVTILHKLAIKIIAKLEDFITKFSPATQQVIILLVLFPKITKWRGPY